jgi:hypothetical protein
MIGQTGEEFIEEIPDVTEETRERWRRELETTPTESHDYGAGLTIDELIDEIPSAVSEWHEVKEAW